MTMESGPKDNEEEGGENNDEDLEFKLEENVTFGDDTGTPKVIRREVGTEIPLAKPEDFDLD